VRQQWTVIDITATYSNVPHILQSATASSLRTVTMRIFHLFTVLLSMVNFEQPLIQWVPEALSLSLKQPGREADHSPPYSPEVKNTWSYIFTPPIRLHGVVLS
jgi:hypothetical protein